MRGERILVTGGAGFIGSNLAKVVEDGSDVVDDMVMSQNGRWMLINADLIT